MWKNETDIESSLKIIKTVHHIIKANDTKSK
jgi:hypothetical protein